MRMNDLRTHQHGLSFVELMIAMALGLVLLSGVIGVFLATQQTYRINQALSEVQENSRSAFQLIARDIRSAGFTGCTNSGTVANTLNAATSADWWSTWGNGIKGYDNGGPTTFTPARVSNTDSLQIMFGGGRSFNVESHNAASAQFKVNINAHGIKADDILVACDSAHVAIFQVTNASQANGTIVHNTGTGAPGNCTKGLGFPVICTANGTPYQFTANSMLFRFESLVWYVAVNSRQTNSLYRVSLTGGAPVYEEILEGVEDIQFRYLRRSASNYQTATEIDAMGAAEWGRIVAVEVEFKLRTTVTKTSVPEELRVIRHIVNLRNRV
jgi:type IV pilus assembly protein PilW